MTIKLSMEDGAVGPIGVSHRPAADQVWFQGQRNATTLHLPTVEKIVKEKIRKLRLSISNHVVSFIALEET